MTYGGGELSEHSHIYQGILGDDGMIRTTDRGYRWIWLDGRELLFDTRGRLKRILTPAGDSQSLIYNKQGQLHYITDSDGRYFELLYDEKSRIVEVKAPDQSIYYHYSEAHQLLHVEYADNSKRQYHYEDAQDNYNLTGITDARGVRIGSYGYNEKDQAIYTHQALVDGIAVEKREIQYQPGQSIVTDSLGRQSIYHYEEQHRHKYVTQIQGTGCTSCAQADSKYSYTEDLQLKTRQSKNGIIEEYDYDQDKRRLSITQVNEEGQRKEIIRYEYLTEEQAKGLGQRRRYHGAHRYLPLKIKRASVNKDGSHEIELSYNQRGQIIQLKEQGYRPQLDDAGNISHYQPIIKQTAYQYSKQGNLLEVDGPKEGSEDISRFEYQRQAFCETLCKELLKRVINAKGDIVYEVLAYDQAGRVLESQREDTHLSNKYDIRGNTIERRQQIKDGQRIVTKQSYDATGQVIKFIKNDDKTYYQYDGAGRMIAEVSATGQQINYTYNSESLLIDYQLQDKQGSILSQQKMEYDVDSRPLRTRDMNNNVINEVSYNNKSQIIGRYDGNGNKTSYEYDNWGRRDKTIYVDGSKRAYHFDVHNNMIEIIDARGNKTQDVYDDFGLRILRKHPDSGVQISQYNERNQLKSVINAKGEKRSYHYDVVSRKLIKLETPESEISYSYDIEDQITSIKSEEFSSSYEYDANGNWLIQRREISGMVFEDKYSYTDQGNLKSHAFADGQVLEYEYIARGKEEGKLKSIKLNSQTKSHKIIKAINYDNANEVNYIYGNDLNLKVNYQSGSKIEQISSQGIYQSEYKYDANQNVIENIINRVSNKYSYDGLNRLSSTNIGKQVSSYDYDENGNRVLEQSANEQRELVYPEYGEGNRLLEIIEQNDTQKLSYDKAGNVLNYDKAQHHYDSQSRLLSYEREGRKTKYLYNEKHQRIKKQNDLEEIYYLYDGAGRLESEYNKTQDSWTHYVYINSRAMAQIQSGEVYYLHTDNLSTPRFATDKDQQIVWKASQNAFGEAKDNNDQVRLRFQGQYYDKESGYHYNWHRYYIPELGRYLTSDPLGIDGGINTYLYVNGNVLSAVDPTGLIGARPQPSPSLTPCEKCDEWMQRNLDEIGLDWLDNLPNCPCVLEKRHKESNEDWGYKKYKHWDGTVEKYHPGAEGGCMRSKPTEEGTAQQCCYDNDSNLITAGAAAGTPDYDAADGWLFGIDGGHISEDVDPHENCGWQKYNQIRKPNNGNNCKENPI